MTPPEILFHEGLHFRVIFGEDASGRRPAQEFLGDRLGTRHSKSRKKIIVTVERFAETPPGGFRDPSRFKPVRDGLHEFRDDQVRLLCAYDGRARLLLLHVCIKKGDELRDEDIDRALSVLNAHRARYKR